MDKKSAVLVDKENLQTRITREFDAPRELVFRAHSEPDLMVKWWGPERYKTTIDKFEFKKGGVWRFVHSDNEGNEFAFHGEYTEIVEPEKITWTFNFEPIGPGHTITETVNFEDAGDGKTKILIVSKYNTIEDLEGMVQSGMEDGLNESHRRLDALLETIV